MNLSNPLSKICTSLGKTNSPLIATLTISGSKGILRPTFTMMDKKSDPETKKYVATREGLTELVAIAEYALSDKLVSNLAKPICKKAGRTDANDIAKVKAGLSLLSIWGCAAVVIPMTCNIILPPIMKALFRNKKHRHRYKKNLDIKEISNQSAQPPIYVKTPKGTIEPVYYFTTYNNSSMKVGGS